MRQSWDNFLALSAISFIYTSNSANVSSGLFWFVELVSFQFQFFFFFFDFSTNNYYLFEKEMKKREREKREK